MADIRKHTTKKGTVSYYVYVTANNRKVYVGKAPTRERARALERLERDRLWQIKNGLRIAESDETFGALALRWVEGRILAGAIKRADDERWRLRKHLLPFFGELVASKITVADIRRFIDHCLIHKVGNFEPRQCLRLMSRFFNELVSAGTLARNPVGQMDRSDWSKVRPKHDPRQTPYLKTKEDIRRLFQSFRTEDVRLMFLVGATAGLRTGEVVALRIEDVDLVGRRMLVQRSYGDTTKDKDPRPVPINDTLLPRLRAWIGKTGRSAGLVFPPRGHGRFVGAQRLRSELKTALARSQLGALTWYQVTRHTFASHWVMDGRSLAKLRDIMGHSSVLVTERYAHLSRDLFSKEDYQAVSLDLEDVDKESVGQHNPSTNGEEAQEDGS